MNFLPVVLGLVMTIPLPSTWTPPEKPNAQIILQEAQADTQAKRYPDALARHLWIHENSVKVDRSFYGVRLSFALMSWLELGKAYPPAMAALRTARDDARQAVLRPDAKETRESFHDFTSINRTLGEEAQTKALFAELDRRKSPIAEDVFRLALPALVKAKEYKLCGNYLQSKVTLVHCRLFFKFQEQMAKDPQFSDRVREISEKSFISETATLIALRVINDRKPEALEIVAVVKKESKSANLHAALDQALQGVVPDSMP